MRICFPHRQTSIAELEGAAPHRRPILPAVRGWYLPIPEILVIIAGFVVQQVYPNPYTADHISGEVAVTIGFLAVLVGFPLLTVPLRIF